jgi:hypothetical protein
VVGITVIQGGETTRDTKRWSNRRAVEAVAPVDRVVATGEVEVSGVGMGLADLVWMAIRVKRIGERAACPRHPVWPNHSPRAWL